MLGESREKATRLLYSLERKIQNDSLLKERYTSFMSEYEELGNMTRVNDEGVSHSVKSYYMPHYDIVREQYNSNTIQSCG